MLFGHDGDVVIQYVMVMEPERSAALITFESWSTKIPISQFESNCGKIERI